MGLLYENRVKAILFPIEPARNESCGPAEFSFCNFQLCYNAATFSETRKRNQHIFHAALLSVLLLLALGPAARAADVLVLTYAGCEPFRRAA